MRNANCRPAARAASRAATRLPRVYWPGVCCLPGLSRGSAGRRPGVVPNCASGTSPGSERQLVVAPAGVGGQVAGDGQGREQWSSLKPRSIPRWAGGGAGAVAGGGVYRGTAATAAAMGVVQTAPAARRRCGRGGRLGAVVGVPAWALVRCAVARCGLAWEWRSAPRPSLASPPPQAAANRAAARAVSRAMRTGCKVLRGVHGRHFLNEIGILALI